MFKLGEVRARARRRFIVTAALLLPGALFASPAHAQAACVGTQSTIVVCVDPTGGTLVDDCFYLGGDTCEPVFVPGPTVWCRDGGMISCSL